MIVRLFVVFALLLSFATHGSANPLGPKHYSFQGAVYCPADSGHTIGFSTFYGMARTTIRDNIMALNLVEPDGLNLSGGIEVWPGCAGIEFESESDFAAFKMTRVHLVLRCPTPALNFLVVKIFTEPETEFDFGPCEVIERTEPSTLDFNA